MVIVCVYKQCINGICTKKSASQLQKKIFFSIKYRYSSVATLQLTYI